MGTPPPHNLALGHPLDGSSLCVCVCVLCGGGVPILCEPCVYAFVRAVYACVRFWYQNDHFGWILVVFSGPGVVVEPPAGV